MLLKKILYTALLTLLITGCSYNSTIEVEEKQGLKNFKATNSLRLVIDAREFKNISISRTIDVFDIDVEYGEAFITSIKNDLFPHFQSIEVAYYEEDIVNYDLLLTVDYIHNATCEGKGLFLCNYEIETKSSLKGKNNIAVIKVSDRFKSDVSALSESMSMATLATLGLLTPITLPASTKVTGDKFKEELLTVNNRVAKKIAKKVLINSVYTSLLNNNKYDKNANFTQYDDIPDLLSTIKAHETSYKKWLFIIGIENYEYTNPVIYSENSAKSFLEVMSKRLGIPEKNTRILINQDATSSKVNYKLRDMLRKVQKGDTVYFYYTGHGIPVPSQDNAPYMLTQDMNPAYIDDERFKLQNIYKQLSDSKANKVIAFIDSCFSGGTDNQALIKGVAATRIKPKKVTFDKNKMIVISAGSGTQYSNKYDATKNRLFSYYVMRGLINNNSDTQRLYDYVKSNVQEKSYEMGSSYEQVPVYDGNIKLKL